MLHQFRHQGVEFDASTGFNTIFELPTPLFKDDQVTGFSLGDYFFWSSYYTGDYILPWATFTIANDPNQPIEELITLIPWSYDSDTFYYQFTWVASNAPA